LIFKLFIGDLTLFSKNLVSWF